MKTTTLALTATAATMVLAQPHQHKHNHMHMHHAAKREVTVTTNVPGPTAFAYVLDGHQISVDEVCKGLEDQELKFADGQAPAGICNSSTVSSTTTASSSTPTTTTTVSTTTAAPTTTTTTTTTTAATSAAAFYAASSAAASDSSWNSATGLTAEFPDGQLSCSTFPSQYGAVNLDYLGFGGWSGLQAVSIVGSFVNSIVTGIAGNTCEEGMMCSYACPPGYQKSQWPSTQGSTGQSVGGLSCSGGKLHLTNPGLSKSLCIEGTGGVQAQNTASQVVSICRTDYPGTESETIPTELQPGSTQPLTCPDAGSYYTWQGQSTSAQYYLNPIGVDAATGCKWGSPGGNIGNYAPINFGVGYSAGKTWLSIFQNAPTTNAQYEGTVEIQGNLSGTCKYSNGQYCGATGCNAQGCTVAVISGTATYVISR